MEDKTKVAVEIFDYFAEKYSEKYADQTLYADGLAEFVKLLPKSNAEVLDLACGPANVAKHILKLQPEIKLTGIDLSPNMIQIAKKHCPEAIFLIKDCRDFGEIEHSFDGIICSFCLPYLSKNDTKKLVEHCYLKLNKGGILYVSTMEGEFSLSGYKPSSTGKGPEAFIHYYPQKFLVDLLSSLGFQLKYESLQEFPDENPSTTQDIILVAQKN